MTKSPKPELNKEVAQNPNSQNSHIKIIDKCDFDQV